MAKRWTCYIHLKNASALAIGKTVQLGEMIGTRGNSGSSKGVHLHLYLTSEISTGISFSFANLKKYAVNPVPYLYYDKSFNTLYISKDWKKALPDPVPPVVDPVERDVTKDQLICHEADLRVREKPDLTGYVIGHLQKDKYCVFPRSFSVSAANSASLMKRFCLFVPGQKLQARLQTFVISR